jgi:hypothetical protein
MKVSWLAFLLDADGWLIFLSTLSRPRNHLMAQPSDPVTQAETYDAFFYGTLLHPEILRKVLRNKLSHLQIAPAILKVRVYSVSP